MESLWKKILEWFLLINWIIPIGFSPEKTFHTTYLQPVADTNVGTDKTCPLRHPRSADFLLAPSFPKRNYNCRSFLRLKKKKNHANLQGHLLDLFRNSKYTAEFSESPLSCTTLRAFSLRQTYPCMLPSVIVFKKTDSDQLSLHPFVRESAVHIYWKVFHQRALRIPSKSSMLLSAQMLSCTEKRLFWIKSYSEPSFRLGLSRPPSLLGLHSPVLASILQSQFKENCHS